MGHAYTLGNKFSGLAATAFTWSTGATTDRLFLADGRIDKTCTSGLAASPITLAVDMNGSVGGNTLVGLALLSHGLYDLSDPVTVTIHTDDNSGFTTPTLAKAASTIPVTEPAHRDAVLLFPSTGERYVRLTFAGTGTIEVVLGELHGIYATLPLARRKSWGHGESEEYVTNNVRLSTGVDRRSFLAGPIRSKSLPFSDLTLTERNELLDMWRLTRGGTSDLLWIDEANSTASAATAAEQDCILGKLQQSMNWTEPDFGLYSPASLELRSLARKAGF